MIRRLWPVVLWSVLGGVLLATAYLLINTTFMLYDDEGYLLLTYRNFISGARLYDDIFSQYGPWPYLYHLLISLGLNEPLTHAVGRSLTAVHWTLCALLVGAIARRLTGRLSAAVFATLISFGLLWQMSSEPSHPGSLISTMLAITVLIVVVTHETGRWSWLGAGIGLAAALLVLTKINIGIFFIAGAGVGALRLTAWPERWRRPAVILAAVGLLAVPWGLMRGKLDVPWVLTFAIQFTVAAAGLLWVTPPVFSSRRIPPRTWGVALGVFLSTILLVAAVMSARGTSISALLQAVLFAPLRQPASFMIGFSWGPAVWPVAAICWLVTARAGWELRQRGEVGRVTRHTLIALRLATGVAFLVKAETWLTIQGVGGFIAYCLPLLPVFLVPLDPRPAAESGSAGAKLWVAGLALPQVLHAYPVAGSQMGWGTFLLLPVLVAGLHDTWQTLASSRPDGGRWWPRAGWSLLILVGSAQLALLLHTGWDRYHTSKPLGLRGAEDIRAGDRARQILRVLTLNAAVQADVLFSRPGMFSYNLWSGVPTPTARNATHWFWLLDESAQTSIINRLRQVPRSAIIISRELDGFLESIHVPMQGPLQGFIHEQYRPLFSLGAFDFMVPLASRAVPFGRVEALAAAAPTDSPTLLQTNVVLDGRLASVQLQSLQSPWAIHENYTPQNARLVLEPINSQGESVGPAIELPQTQPVRGLFRLNIYAHRPPDLTQPSALVLVGLDPAGVVVSESVF